jgi:tetratricopeptide (TPR) repeat protein
MKKTILSILLFFSTASVFSQYIDSLKQALIFNNHDTDRVFTLLRLSNAYSDFKRDSAMQFAQEALDLAQQNEFKKGEAQALNMIGSIFEGTGNYLKSFEYRLESLKIAEEIKNQKLIAAIYNNLARVSTERSDYKIALGYLFKAKTLFEKQNDKRFLSDALLNIGDNYERNNQLDSALFFQKEAYQLALSVGYINNLGTIVSNLGSINSKLNNSDTAIKYFRSAVELLKNAEDEESLAGTYYEISKHFYKIKNIDSSFFYAMRSYTLSTKVSDLKKILNASEQLSHLYEQIGNSDSALKYTKLAKQTGDSILSAQKIAQLVNMQLTEDARQKEIARKEAKAEEERKNNLQLIAIAVFIITFFAILIIFSRRKAHPQALKYLGLLGLLLLFEFIAVFVHPYIAEWTHHTPFYMLLILVAVGAFLVPLHHKLEHWVKEWLARGGQHEIKDHHPQKHSTIQPDGNREDQQKRKRTVKENKK